MKKLACCTAIAVALAFAVPGHTQAQTSAPAQPGTPAPAAQSQPAPPPTGVAAARGTVKKTVVRKRRVRARGSSDNIANRLNAQELARGGMGAGVAGRAPAYAGPGYGRPPGPILAAAPGYPPPPFYRPPPPPVWYPPPFRPWGPWWRPWRPWRPYWWW